jgi:hypothetical protein
MKLLHLHLFGTALGGAGVEAAPEAVPNGAFIDACFSFLVSVFVCPKSTIFKL